MCLGRKDGKAQLINRAVRILVAISSKKREWKFKLPEIAAHFLKKHLKSSFPPYGLIWHN